MALELKLPDLGENIDHGTVVRVLVAAGDRVAVDQPVLELETEKASVEVPAAAAGTVTEVRVKAGETVRVGQTMLVLDAPGAATPATMQSGPARALAKATPAVAPAPVARPTARIEPAAAPVSSSAVSVSPTSPPAPLFASPAVRQAAREVGVELASVSGSGPGGRVTYGDVLKAAGAGGSPAGPAPEPLPDFAAFGPVDRQPLSTIRKTTARRLAHSWATIPHVAAFDAADVTRIEALRKQQADKAGPDGAKLSVTAILVKIVSEALRAFPAFNASLDMERGEVVLKQYVHIGVAVDTPNGLLVPVIRDADRKGALDLSAELARLAEKARGKKLGLDEMRGGCFTVSNLGGLGGRHFAPIINPPEAAILGVGRAAVEPVWIEGAFQPRPRMPLTLCYDHRLIDGADATRFLRWVVEAIEEPARILAGP
jgi:pyruvate dehydrogenase E2 component (dihydrolipoamide acetyltransferase)